MSHTKKIPPEDLAASKAILNEMQVPMPSGTIVVAPCTCAVTSDGEVIRNAFCPKTHFIEETDQGLQIPYGIGR